MPNPGERSDPFPAFNFYISFIDSTSVLANQPGGTTAQLVGGFTECSGLDATLQVEEYPEGGENSFVHKFPTRMTYANIILKRGVVFTNELWEWHFAYVVGNGKRRDGQIILRDEQHKAAKVWRFKRGLPLKWTGPTFNASQNAVAIETLEIMHEGLELVSP